MRWYKAQVTPSLLSDEWELLPGCWFYSDVWFKPFYDVIYTHSEALVVEASTNQSVYYLAGCAIACASRRFTTQHNRLDSSK